MREYLKNRIKELKTASDLELEQYGSRSYYVTLDVIAELETVLLHASENAGIKMKFKDAPVGTRFKFISDGVATDLYVKIHDHDDGLIVKWNGLVKGHQSYCCWLDEENGYTFDTEIMCVNDSFEIENQESALEHCQSAKPHTNFLCNNDAFGYCATQCKDCVKEETEIKSNQKIPICECYVIPSQTSGDLKYIMCEKCLQEEAKLLDS